MNSKKNPANLLRLVGFDRSRVMKTVRDRNSMRRELAKNTYRIRVSKMPDETIAITPTVKAATSKRVMKGWSS
jgi:hypothetical protein